MKITLHAKILLLLSFAILFNSCSKEKEMDFGKLNIKAVTTVSASEIQRNSAVITGKINTDNGASVTEAGVTITSQGGEKKTRFSGSSIPSTFTVPLTDLIPGTRYTATAYATNKFGTASGEAISFTTEKAVLATVSTVQFSNVARTSATVTGNITDNGGYPVTSRGICYSQTTDSPRIENSSYVRSGSGNGTFSSNLQGLAPGTRYYARAFATTEFGTAYASAITFSTSSVSRPGNVIINLVNNITLNNAWVSASVEDDGGATILGRGIVVSSTDPVPAMSQNNTRPFNPPGTGPYGIYLSGLTPGTTYYVRAYASNSVGITYSEVVQFKTLSASYPSGFGITIYNVTATQAYANGAVTNDGGAVITTKGFVYSPVNTSPMLGTGITYNAGSGTGGFNTILSNLQPNTTYYIRIFATNEAGTAYGPVTQFRTATNLAVGQSYQGGTIAYIFQSGDPGYVQGEVHGLIVANISAERAWGCQGTNISTFTTIGTGNSNTISIVSSCAGSNAARYCYDLSLNGYSDWYLPSYNELQKIYANRSHISVSGVTYWASTQFGNQAEFAYNIDFATGNSFYTSKSALRYVLPVRTF